MAKIGRPSKYKPEFCQMLVEHMEKGNCFKTFAALIDVDQDTLYRWAKSKKEFMAAKNEGEIKSLRWWSVLGKSMAQGKVPNGNSAVYIFTMKNRFQWRDKIETVDSDSFDDIDFVDE